MKLLRPDIPTRVRIKVARRQLEAFGASAEMLKRAEGERQDIYLDRLLTGLSLYFENLFRPLHLDHDPALVNRKKIFNRAGEHVGYKPAANNPKYLVYRTKEDHDRKTRVRGDGAQYSDLALARKNKRIEKRRTKNANAKGAIRKKGNNRQRQRELFPSGRGFPKARREWGKRPHWPVRTNRDVRTSTRTETPPSGE